MKAFFKIISIIVGLAIAGVILYAAVTIAFPVLESKATYTKNLPTIEILESRCDSLTAVIDSFKKKSELLEMKIELQEELINSQKLSVAIQKKIQSQLDNIETRISNSNESITHEPNDRK